jgi:outer membrane protein
MRNLLKLGAFVALLVVGVQAQAQNKFGHINSDQLLLLMPETNVAKTELEKFNKELEGQLQEMYAEYQKKVTEFQQGGELMTEPVKQTKLNNIQDLEGRINEFQQTATQSLQEKEVELLTPVIEKAQNAINLVAKTNKFTYVFDSAKGTILFAEESQDITGLVKTELGL